MKHNTMKHLLLLSVLILLVSAGGCKKQDNPVSASVPSEHASVRFVSPKANDSILYEKIYIFQWTIEKDSAVQRVVVEADNSDGKTVLAFETDAQRLKSERMISIKPGIYTFRIRNVMGRAWDTCRNVIIPTVEFNIYSPAQGDVLHRGAATQIKYGNASTQAVTFDVSEDNGQTWKRLFKTSEVGPVWKVNAGPSELCKLRMRTVDSVLSTESGTFRIDGEGWFSITWPKEGSQVRMGMDCPITHVNAAGDSIAFDVSTNGGADWKTVIPFHSDSHWFVDGGPYPDCRMRMRNGNNTHVYTTKRFSITDSYLEEHFPLRTGMTMKYLYEQGVSYNGNPSVSIDSMFRSISILGMTETSDAISYTCQYVDSKGQTAPKSGTITCSKSGLQKISANFAPFNQAELLLYRLRDKDAATVSFYKKFVRGSGYYEAWQWTTAKGVGLQSWRYTDQLAMHDYRTQLWTYKP